MENSRRYWRGVDSVVDLDDVSIVTLTERCRGFCVYNVALRAGGTIRVEGERLIGQFLEYKKIT